VIALTRCYERLSSRPKIRAEQWQRLAEDKAFPIDAARRDLEFAPRPLSEGVRVEAAALGLLAASLGPSARRAADPVTEETVADGTTGTVRGRW
jgi:hypothetical protein